jgi:hypothetical protein
MLAACSFSHVRREAYQARCSRTCICRHVHTRCDGAQPVPEAACELRSDAATKVRARRPLARQRSLDNMQPVCHSHMETLHVCVSCVSACLSCVFAYKGKRPSAKLTAALHDVLEHIAAVFVFCATCLPVRLHQMHSVSCPKPTKSLHHTYAANTCCIPCRPLGERAVFRLDRQESLHSMMCT